MGMTNEQRRGQIFYSLGGVCLRMLKTTDMIEKDCGSDRKTQLSPAPEIKSAYTRKCHKLCRSGNIGMCNFEGISEINGNRKLD
jgi:hypothetical protein